jgi:hypothetical protein
MKGGLGAHVADDDDPLLAARVAKMRCVATPPTTPATNFSPHGQPDWQT